MLTENDLVDAMRSWLEADGYSIKSYCYDTQRGDDIHAVDSNGKDLFVECKGAFSKAGNELNHWRNASGSFFNALRDAVHFRPTAMHAIAVPDIKPFHDLFDCLRDTLDQNGIAVFWVKSKREVTAWWPR